MKFIIEHKEIIASTILFVMSELIAASKLKSNSVTGFIIDVIKIFVPKKELK